VQPGAAADDFLQKTYPQLYAKAKHVVVMPGSTVAVAGLNVLVVTSAGQTIKRSLPGAGASNAYCAGFKPGENNAEDPMSVGTLVTFGRFRTIHLGDLTKNKEFELMCPSNQIGSVDVLLGLHHGQDTSNSDVLVHALRPRVAIMNNGNAQRRTARRDEDAVHVARPRGSLADPFLSAQWVRNTPFRIVHRQRDRRVLFRDAGGPDRRAGAWAQCAPTARS
jgi:hypothetical protein